MSGAQTVEDRYNRVVYVDLPLPPDFHIRERRRPSDPAPAARRRNAVPAIHRCQRCGADFAPRSRAASFKRVRGKVYRRRFCSRACYRQSLVGRPADTKGGTRA